MRKILLLFCLFTALRAQALPAYDFTVTDSDGNTHSLYADYVNQGKAVVIEFFFTTCPPCNTHAPYFQTLYTQMKQQFAGNVEFFLITTLTSDTNTKVKTYKTNKGLTMPGVGYDGNSYDALAEFQSGTFGLFWGTPTFVVIAPYTGEVFFNITGGSPQLTMDKIGTLTTHLLQPPPSAALCNISTESGDGISGVKVYVDAPVWDTAMTVDANYRLADLPPLQTTLPYRVWADKNDAPLNGVSTYDLVLISKHILGLQALDSDLKKTAADVNRSGTITTFDIVEIRKLILGIYDAFPQCRSWSFVPDTASDVNGYCLFFTGVKMGDVNGTAVPSGSFAASDNRDPELLISANDALLQSGESYTLALSVNDYIGLLGLQAALYLDPGALALESLTAPMLSGFAADNWYFKEDGALTVSWNSLETVRLLPGDAVLELQLRALRPVRLSEALRIETQRLVPEVYCEEGCSGRPLNLGWRSEPKVSVFPNPARGVAFLDIQAPSAASSRVELVDSRGRRAWARDVNVRAGANRIRIAPEGLPEGLYTVLFGYQAVARLYFAE